MKNSIASTKLSKKEEKMIQHPTDVDEELSDEELQSLDEKSPEELIDLGFAVVSFYFPEAEVPEDDDDDDDEDYDDDDFDDDDDEDYDDDEDCDDDDEDDDDEEDDDEELLQVRDPITDNMCDMDEETVEKYRSTYSDELDKLDEFPHIFVNCSYIPGETDDKIDGCNWFAVDWDHLLIDVKHLTDEERDALQKFFNIDLILTTPLDGISDGECDLNTDDPKGVDNFLMKYNLLGDFEHDI